MSKNLKEKIIEEAKKIEEDCTYSSKTQFEAADSWRKIHLWLGIPATIAAAIAGAAALSQFDNHNIIAGVLAIIVAALSAVATFLNPNEKATCHYNAGNKYNSVKRRVRIFREVDCAGNNSIEDLNKKLDEFGKEKDDLSLASPLTGRKSYEKAKKGIESGEADYKVDKENV